MLWVVPSLAQGQAAPLYENPPGPALNLYGATGLIDMPTAEHQEPDTINTTVSYMGGPATTVRTTVTFQITDRLSGSFRYSSIDNYNLPGNSTLTRFDRSFDLRYRVLDEGHRLPAITVGLQDFAGTGIFAGEYIVATKKITPELNLTAGLGWGRLAGDSGAARNRRDIGRGGVPRAGHWFRGAVRPFGGLEWITPISGLSFKAEYSSDTFAVERERGGFRHRSPINTGLEWNRGGAVTYGLYHLHGSSLVFRASLSFNPRRAPAPSGLEKAPTPVFARPRLQPGWRFDTGWKNRPGINAMVRKDIQDHLKPMKLQITALKITEDTATVYLRNPTYRIPAQAVGRAARALSRATPASVNFFRIILTARGLPVTSVTIRRSDLESLEYDPDGAENLLARARITDAPARPPDGLEYADGRFPRLRWFVTSSLRTSYFDPDAPVRVELGIRAGAAYHIAPGLSVSGSILKPLAGNLDNITRGANTSPGVPQVRSLSARYFAEQGPILERLTGDYLFKLRPDIYGRVSGGLFETQYGGVSAEILWNPANTGFALGAELNYVQQRDFEQRFGFRDYRVLTGHVSGYWDWDNGFAGQVDVGRYLAGDAGATFTLNRRFRNGWKVGAFFTLTDMRAEDFGEGSFDKGITLTLPLSWGIGTASRTGYTTVLRPLTRDGGARVAVKNRLYPAIREADSRAITRTWGRVWR